jgi:hypothetical protein
VIDLTHQHTRHNANIEIANKRTSIKFNGRCVAHYSTEDFARFRGKGRIDSESFSEIEIYKSVQPSGWYAANMRYKPGSRAQLTRDVRMYFYGPYKELDDLQDKMIFESGRCPQYWDAAFSKAKTLE